MDRYLIYTYVLVIVYSILLVGFISRAKTVGRIGLKAFKGMVCLVSLAILSQVMFSSQRLFKFDMKTDSAADTSLQTFVAVLVLGLGWGLFLAFKYGGDPEHGIQAGLRKQQRGLNFTQHFERLLDDFSRIQLEALQYASPNYEDDFLFKLAIIGFSQNMPLSAWTLKELEFIQALRNRMEQEGTFNAGAFGDDRVGAFLCLCLGYLMGLLSSHRITDTEFLEAINQLPDFVAMHLSRLEMH